MIRILLPYLAIVVATLAATLILTPIVREFHRHLGMVDRPDPRRINKTPIPRGGGIAIVIGVLVPYLAFHYFTGRSLIYGVSNLVALKLMAIGVLMSLLGLADDRFSLAPRVKLLGQVVLAALVWAWVGLGFRDLWPALPAPLDAVLTVFWIVGAVNAFNLIDGLDGLASGLALIAMMGMAGGLFFMHHPAATLPYFALAGGLLGFLCYNYNPASVFLGDSGSMFLGFVVSTMPMTSHDPNSMLVSVGVPLLAMGVPIFDTSLAIIRRTLRRLLIYKEGGNKTSGEVMSADSDHLHHRILRSTGLNQRKTAWIIYFAAVAAVATGLVAMSLKSRAGGLWLAAVAIASVVIFRDAKIELFEAGKLLSSLAHKQERRQRRRLANIAVPMYVGLDLLLLAFAYVLSSYLTGQIVDTDLFYHELPIYVISVFLFAIGFGVYRTAWSRAKGTNYSRLLFACGLGAIAAAVLVYYWAAPNGRQLLIITVTYAAWALLLLVTLRQVRPWMRDLFYKLDCVQLEARPEVERVLVYGAGLRYDAFRRELMRKTAANSRVVVGIIDDDLYLKGKYIGDLRVLGTLSDARQIIKRERITAVVVACEISAAWRKVVLETLKPTGVKLSQFVLEEHRL